MKKEAKVMTAEEVKEYAEKEMVKANDKIKAIYPGSNPLKYRMNRRETSIITGLLKKLHKAASVIPTDEYLDIICKAFKATWSDAETKRMRDELEWYRQPSRTILDTARLQYLMDIK